MAQETKVGLVVGLGFIVCFAMILANRGGVERIRPQMPYQLFRNPASPGQSPTAIPPEEQVRKAGRADPPTLPVDRPTSAEVPSPERRDSAANRRDDTDREPGTLADPEHFTRRRRPIPRALELPDSAVASADRNRDNGMSLLVGESSPTGVDQERESEPVAVRVAQNRAATMDAELPPSLAPYADQLERVPRRRKPSATTEVRHTVEKGETLTGIARRYYGSASPAIVRSVFEANQSVMSSPDMVVVGSALRLPVVEGIVPRHGATGAPLGGAVADAKNPERRADPAYRLYKVKKGDLLGTIAQQHLGSSKRWKEILALNEGLFPDARHLPTGVEIRIPLDTLVDAR